MNSTSNWSADLSGRRGHAVQFLLAMLLGGIVAILLIVLFGLDGRRDYAASPNTKPAANATAATQATAAQAGNDQPLLAPLPTTSSASNSNAGAPGDDPARPFGLPLLRDDWVVEASYEQHGGLRPAPDNNRGAVDFGYAADKDALGADVIATHSGTIKLLIDDPTYGNLVYVLGQRWSTTYGHLQDFAVKEGDTVMRGQLIGHMGATGEASSPRVDYQVWENGANVNPMDYCNCSGTQGPGVK